MKSETFSTWRVRSVQYNLVIANLQLAIYLGARQLQCNTHVGKDVLEHRQDSGTRIFSDRVVVTNSIRYDYF